MERHAALVLLLTWHDWQDSDLEIHTLARRTTITTPKLGISYECQSKSLLKYGSGSQWTNKNQGPPSWTPRLTGWTYWDRYPHNEQQCLLSSAVREHSIVPCGCICIWYCTAGRTACASGTLIVACSTGNRLTSQPDRALKDVIEKRWDDKSRDGIQKGVNEHTSFGNCWTQH